jgi:hypothetical protein
MKRLIVSALVLATVLATVLGLVGTALAGEEAFLSGKDLHELCKGGDVSCTTYVMGVLDAMNMMESRSGGGSAFCAPEITSDEVTDVVTKHLRRHPARWDSPAATLVIQALVEEFPCDGKGE